MRAYDEPSCLTPYAQLKLLVCWCLQEVAGLGFGVSEYWHAHCIPWIWGCGWKDQDPYQDPYIGDDSELRTLRFLKIHLYSLWIEQQIWVS